MPPPLQIGGIIYPRVDQADFTGPFEVLSRIPDSTFHVLWKDKQPVRDGRGLILTPDTSFDECPGLDVLLIPGGGGQQALMDDDTVLSFIRRQSAGARYVLSVCTGALICGAAGLLVGRRATTYWAAHHLLPYFGATPINARFVEDGHLITTAGVTAGIDGAFHLVAKLCGDRIAQEIQLYMQYAPEPPFDSGTPDRAPAEVLQAVRARAQDLADRRLETAKRIALQLGVTPRHS
ncbi:MAG TPA: DJ-1/PfpI family protein [Tepidisphaeraceae bacterium]